MYSLKELREMYLDNQFVIFKIDHVEIKPKLVTIKEDLTVWHDGGCIINGMHDQLFGHGADLKSVNKSLMDAGYKFKERVKKRL